MEYLGVKLEGLGLEDPTGKQDSILPFSWNRRKSPGTVAVLVQHPGGRTKGSSLWRGHGDLFLVFNEEGRSQPEGLGPM